MTLYRFVLGVVLVLLLMDGGLASVVSAQSTDSSAPESEETTADSAEGEQQADVEELERPGGGLGKDHQKTHV